MLRVVVLLEDEPSPQSEIQSALEQVFIKDVSIHYCIQVGCHVPFTEEWLRLASLSFRPDWWSAAEMVVLLEGSALFTEKRWSCQSDHRVLGHLGKGCEYLCTLFFIFVNLQRFQTNFFHIVIIGCCL